HFQSGRRRNHFDPRYCADSLWRQQAAGTGQGPGPGHNGVQESNRPCLGKYAGIKSGVIRSGQQTNQTVDHKHSKYMKNRLSRITEIRRLVAEADHIKEDHAYDGVDRRGFLKCMAWAGTGMLWTVTGGVLGSKILGPTIAGAAESTASN